MEKVYNEEWMKDILGRSKEAMDDSSGSLPEIDWVQYKKGFKKNITFKLMPANMKENNVFSIIVATHWIQMPDGKTKRFICPEETVHLKGQRIKCPICEAKRKLKAMGFTDEQLSVQGKFGLMPVFDPKFTSNAKVVVLQSDEKQDWDKAHISVLQQNGTFMTVWLAQKYASNEIPNFTEITSSNQIKFSRPTDSGKWEREVSFSMFTPSEEVAAKLRDENEALTLPDLWKMPTDQEFIEMSQIMDEMKNNYIAARDTMNGNDNSSVTYEDDSDIPF
nr:MAG TPA: DNA binding protein like protein [Caudoviricetes sp.]